MIFSILLWVHIICAVVSLGATITYFPWLFKVGKSPQSLVFTLRTVKFMDDWMVNPAYVIALFTGDGLIRYAEASEGFSYHSPWIIGALILYAAVSILGIFVYAPTLKKLIKLAENTGAGTQEYQKAANNTLYLGMLMVLITLTITFLMVVKPQIW